MKNIVMQVGHWNIQNNILTALHGSTGAPGEMEKNKAITFRAAELLRARGFNVVVTDANANSDPTITNKDWDLFIADHCDADSATLSSGFADYPLPSTDDATAESQRIAKAISAKFFPESGITYRPERVQKSDDIKYYYMWKYLSAKTPCVLIEMGESMDPHDSVILKDTERCAAALARGICYAFNVAYDLPTPTPPPAPVPDAKDKQIADLTKQLADQKVATSNAVKLGLDQLAQQKKEFQAKLDGIKADLEAIVQKCTI